MNGIINLLKPPGISSNGAVVYLRGMLGARKIGHAGTLDPGASGVLVICVGKATKLSEYLMDGAKEYVAEICFGKSTDTGDSYGRVVETGGEIPCAGRVKEALRSFLGETSQRTPAYSAAKHGGKKLYELARKGVETPEKIRKIVIHELEYIKETGEDSHLIRVACGRGTYIRVLCEDIGKRLGTCAYMSFLARTKDAGLDISGAYTFEELEGLKNKETALLRADTLLERFPQIRIGADKRKALANGGVIGCALPDGIYRAYADGDFLGLAEVKGGAARMAVLIAES